MLILVVLSNIQYFEGSSVNNHCCGAAVQPYAYGCGSMASEEERQETGDSLNWC